MKLAQTLAFAAASLIPAYAAAQACDTTPDGEASPDNACLICDAGEWISLPERTSCGESRSLLCDGSRVYRLECVPMADNAEMTECVETSRWDDCPNGLLCDTAAGVCRRFCEDNADCRTGFECDIDQCVALPEPDMGGGVPDMGGGEPDMSTVSDMGGTGSDMGGGGGGGGGIDYGYYDDNDPPRDYVEDRGGCASVEGSASAGSLLAVLFLMFRRRSR